MERFRCVPGMSFNARARIQLSGSSNNSLTWVWARQRCVTKLNGPLSREGEQRLASNLQKMSEQPHMQGMVQNPAAFWLKLGAGWAEERYLQGLASLGNDPVRGCVYDSFRSSVVVQSVIDRWRPGSSVVLLDECDNLLISSPGIQRLWEENLLTWRMSFSANWFVKRGQMISGSTAGDTIQRGMNFYLCLVKQSSGSELHQTSYGKDGTKEWSEENAWDRGI